MATPFPIPVTAAQVGTYFVGQYYQVLQQQPEFVHQFYSDASTAIRIDGGARETATSMLQIHALVMSMSFSGIEIKSAQSLESWNGGVLVMVSGAVQLKDFNFRRKFAQTFFLAPQEKGYFVLNDVFHFIDEEPLQHPAAFLLAQNNLETQHNASTAISEPVSSYLNGEIQAKVDPVNARENGVVDSHNFPEQHLHQIPDAKSTAENDSVEATNNLCQTAVNIMEAPQPAQVDEIVGEPQKHTYASILRVAKGQSAPVVSSQPTVGKHSPSSVSEWNSSLQTNIQQPVVASDRFDGSKTDTAEEASGLEDQGEIKSVYVRNLPPTVSENDIAEAFKKFGDIRPDGVVIRSRKDVGFCYAFVEFEDMSGVHNAVQAGSAQVAGRQVYIEERRPNSNIPFRGARGRGGRGRGSYQGDGSRGRFAPRNFGVDRDHSKARGNGFYRPVNRQDRGFPSQASKAGQSSSE